MIAPPTHYVCSVCEKPMLQYRVHHFIPAVPARRASGIGYNIEDTAEVPEMSWFLCSECVAAHGLGES